MAAEAQNAPQTNQSPRTWRRTNRAVGPFRWAMTPAPTIPPVRRVENRSKRNTGLRSLISLSPCTLPPPNLKMGCVRVHENAAGFAAYLRAPEGRASIRMAGRWVGKSRGGRLANCCEALQPMSTSNPGGRESLRGRGLFPRSLLLPALLLAEKAPAGHRVASAWQEGSSWQNAAAGEQPATWAYSRSAGLETPRGPRSRTWVGEASGEVRRGLDEAVATPGAPAEPGRSRVARARRECPQEPPLTGGAVLEKHLGVGICVESDDHGLPCPKAGRAQVAGGADHGIDRFGRSLPCRLPLLELLALGDDHPGCSLGQGGCVLAAELAAGGNRLARLDSVGVQELGRSPARRSALPVVVPVDLLRHRWSSRTRS